MPANAFVDLVSAYADAAVPAVQVLRIGRLSAKDVPHLCCTRVVIVAPWGQACVDTPTKLLRRRHEENVFNVVSFPKIRTTYYVFILFT